jgi:hypothetical protein
VEAGRARVKLRARNRTAARKKYKLEVRVDVDGDGTTDEKQFIVQHRPFVYTQTDKDKGLDKKKSE